MVQPLEAMNAAIPIQENAIQTVCSNKSEMRRKGGVHAAVWMVEWPNVRVRVRVSDRDKG